MKTVSRDQFGAEELALPPRVQEALGELVGSAKEGLLALSVGVGLGVPAELLEEEVIEVVGAKGKHIPERTAVRHGYDSGEVTLGGRRVAVERPRARTAMVVRRCRRGFGERQAPSNARYDVRVA
jgi:putative transposase